MAEPTNQPGQARIGDFGYSGSAGSSPELDALQARAEDLEARLVAAETQRQQAEKALTDAMAYARDRKLECRRDAAGHDSQHGYEFIGMANGFSEMAEHLHSTLAVLAAGRQEPA